MTAEEFVLLVGVKECLLYEANQKIARLQAELDALKPTSEPNADGPTKAE